MIVLGIESTAHTFGVGLVEADDLPGPPPHTSPPPIGACKVLANRTALYTPPPLGEKGGTTGGIHPREAANHHAERAAGLLRDALEDAGLAPGDVDAVAFSQSPGMGPCLRTGATVARTLALTWGVPLAGVNHCVAHLEIGRTLCGVDDPLLLYASGGNTQVIAFSEGRYRVFGETLDVGVGNFLDKFARRMGLPFPGGPKVEALARDGSVLLELPYSVKGMDMAFSGILTAADALLAKHRAEDVAYSVQETAFAMLTEVTERALAHVGKHAVVLGGGVACNERLTDMVRAMCEARGASVHRPPKPVLLDNGVMIAWTGALQLASGTPTAIEASAVDQRERTDARDVPWRVTTATPGDPTRGAEAVIHLENGSVRKERVPKPYRHAALDAAIRAQRTKLEARLLADARAGGVATPLVRDVDVAHSSLTMERVAGDRLRDVLDGLSREEQGAVLRALGRALGRLHAAGVAHGDPTTSNAFLLSTGEVCWIDFGLGVKNPELEAYAVDLHVLAEALEATHRGVGMDAVLAGYEWGGRGEVLRVLGEVEMRGRYRGT